MVQIYPRPFRIRVKVVVKLSPKGLNLSQKPAQVLIVGFLVLIEILELHIMQHQPRSLGNMCQCKGFFTIYGIDKVIKG